MRRAVIAHLWQPSPRRAQCRHDGPRAVDRERLDDLGRNAEIPSVRERDLEGIVAK
jgi:hypothetical protein